MPDTYTVFTTNQPNEEKQVDEAELVDLIRQGLVVKGKGDIGPRGTLVKRLQDEDTPPAVTITEPKQEA